MQIIVAIPTEERHRALLEAAAPEAAFTYCRRRDLTPELLAGAEVILGNPEPQMLRHAQKLRWLQLRSAGTNGYCEPGVLPQGVALTNATGAYGLAISEHMIGQLFMLKKKLHLYYQNQLEHRWASHGEVTAIEGSTLLCLGLGDIGGRFARKMKGLGCHVIGVKRRTGERPDYVDELYTVDRLDEQLPRADILAMSLPGTDETTHILDARRLALMKPSAVVLNVGRGSAIDPEALLAALQNGVIAGAAVDVTEPEPLPADSPLWAQPNLLITPHISGGYSLPATREEIIAICARNLAAFVAGRPLENVVDMQTGYRR